METGGALEHLRHNTTLNEAVLHGRAKVGPCDWLACGSPAQASGKAAVHADPVLGKHWDIVIGSDLVYDEAGVKMLPHVFNQLVTPSNTAFYCHTLHRYDMMDADFLHALKEHGLNVEEVRRRGEVTPPPSPPPFECLFNEHRLVIWKLTRPQ
jgi:predicted nicotinamide N-methyase